MTEEQRVWEAIRRELQSRGDADIKAGLAWLSVDDQIAIARAAIDAISRC